MTASTPASCKDKGRRFQQEIAAMICGALDLPDADVISRPMGSPGADIILSTAAQVRFPFATECKRAEKWELHRWWQQAQNNAEPDNGIEPLLVFRRNREQTYAITTPAALDRFACAGMVISHRGPAVKWPIKYWMRIAAAAQSPDTIPVVTIQNGSHVIALMLFADLLRIIRPELAELASRGGDQP